MDRPLRRAALVTGAASGIGEAVARRLAADGTALALVDRDGEGLARVANAVGGAATFVHDIADEAAWTATEAGIRAEFGSVDHVVANAGVAGAAPIADLDFAEWRRILSANLDGTFLTLRAGMRLLRDGGSAVVVASASGIKAEPGVAAYGASKAAVIQLAKVAAKEGAPRRVRVNAIAPGGVETPVWRDVPFFRDLVVEHGGERAAFDALAAMATPLARYATADETAAQIAFLLSDAAATITGAVLVADGGYTL